MKKTKPVQGFPNRKRDEDDADFQLLCCFFFSITTPSFDAKPLNFGFLMRTQKSVESVSFGSFLRFSIKR